MLKHHQNTKPFKKIYKSKPIIIVEGINKKSVQKDVQITAINNQVQASFHRNKKIDKTWVTKSKQIEMAYQNICNNKFNFNTLFCLSTCIWFLVYIVTLYVIICLIRYGTQFPIYIYIFHV
jgi:hypothetical protein